MLTYEEMQYFAAFAESGTLTNVAEKFSISQPTITRAMKKAEEVFDVPLFNRTKNSIHLNENGRLAAREIAVLLRQTDQMIDRIRAYDRANRTISIGTAAALPLPGLVSRASSAFPDKPISTEMQIPDVLVDGLEKNRYQFIVLPYKPDEGRYLSRKVGEEHLFFLLPKNHRFARRKSLTLSEMNGENMLLFTDIGFWGEIVRKKMPDSRFLLQSERYSFEELIVNSVLPCFSTDIGMKGHGSYDNRRAVPISDPEVNVSYYLVCKKENRKEFAAFFK